MEHVQDISQLLRLSPLTHRLDQHIKRHGYPCAPTAEPLAHQATPTAKQKPGSRTPAVPLSIPNLALSTPAITSYGPEIPHPSIFRAPLQNVSGFYVIEVGQEVGIFYDW